MPARKEVQRLVTVELTKSGGCADLVVFNVGGAALKRSELLKKLNAGRFDEVPQELTGSSALEDKSFPASWRGRSEVALWNKH